MIRVLHIVNSMNYGGLETFIMNVYRNIDRSKIQFDFLVHVKEKCDYDDEIKKLGGKIYYVEPRNRGFIKNRKSINKFFSEHKDIQIVHAHLSSLSYIEPLKYAKKYRIPVRIIHSHSTREGGSFIHKYIHKINQLFIDNIITDHFGCSDVANIWMFGKKRYENGVCKLINNGIDTSRFIYNIDTRKNIRKILNIEDKIVLGHVGRFSYPKNHSFILDVFASIYEKNKNFTLLLVGDGELRASIERKIKELGIEKAVILIGNRPDVNEILQAMDMFIFPSHYEGLPLTLVEAQTCGLKCFVSKNITRQVEVTPNIKYLDIDNIKQWSDEILKNKKYIRESNEISIKNSGFDIKDVTIKLQDFYIQRVK